MADCLQSQIADALQTKLSTVSDFNYVAFDKVRLKYDEFRSHEFPAVQCYGTTETCFHISGRVQVEWDISVEILLRSSSQGIVDQRDLWNLKDEVLKTIFDDPQLGLTKFMQELRWAGGFTDINFANTSNIISHTINLKAIYYTQLIGTCF